MNLPKLSLGLAVFTLVLWQHRAEQAVGGSIQIVSPSRYADREAPGAATSPIRNGRLQQVFPAADFVSLPPGYRFITQMASRPDGNDARRPLTATYDDLLVRLSTTAASPPNLSWTFSDNIGADETIVFDGPSTAGSTDNVGPAGGPKEFDEILTFEVPFEYDPNDGNLLVDQQWIGMSATSTDIVPFPGVEGQLIWTTNPASGRATLAGGGIVYQFTFVDAALGDMNNDGRVNGLDIDPFVDVLLNGPYQPEADMNDDRLVNGLDVDPFVAAIVGGGTQQIPEPSTLLLAIVTLGVVGGWRKWGG